jgi:hypothetical protein
MDKEINTTVATETSRLLAELDAAIDQSSVMREIVDKHQLLHNLESITGPSGKTQALRSEIELMERALRFDRE